MANSDASQTSLKGQSDSIGPKSGHGSDYFNCRKITMLFAPVGILLKDVRQWPSHISVILAIFVQVVGETQQLTRLLLVFRNRPINYGFTLAGSARRP